MCYEINYIFIAYFYLPYVHLTAVRSKVMFIVYYCDLFTFLLAYSRLYSMQPALLQHSINGMELRALEEFGRSFFLLGLI